LEQSADRDKVQVLTKFCCFGRDMAVADNLKTVRRVRHCVLCNPSRVPI
jgi:hypothetical protein